LQLIFQERLTLLDKVPFSTQGARKRCSIAQRFGQYLRATNCYKLSDILSLKAIGVTISTFVTLPDKLSVAQR
jgi:hypothetical protein